MKRRNTTPAIPPFIDAFGRPTYENPFGHNRPNPALNTAAHVTAPIVAPVLASEPERVAPEVVTAPAVKTPSAAPPSVHAPRRERQAQGPSPIARGTRQLQRLAHQARLHRHNSVPTSDAPAPVFAGRVRGRKVLATGVGFIALIVGASAAFAFFTAHGTGSGTATAGTLQPVTVTATVGGDTPSSSLLPGGSADVILRVNNPNTQAVKLVSASANGTPSASGAPSCTTTGVTFTNQPSLNVTIAASGTTLVHLPNAAAMSTGSSSGCQGATFNIPISITVHQP